MPKVSIIVPAFNEEQNLPLLRERIDAAFANRECEYELLVVDDHSSDTTPQILADWAGSDPHVKLLRLSRNCGSHAAISAGLHHCTGDAAVILAADLQDPPEVIPQLMEKWQEGTHVVWAVREGREGESLSSTFTAGCYYWLMRRLGFANMPPQGADFLLVDRKVIDAFCEHPEKHTSFFAAVLWMGFRQEFVPYVKQARHAGTSKWTLAKKIKLFVDSIVSFSYLPIRAATLLGLTVALLGFGYACFVVVNAVRGFPVAGWSSLMVVVLLLGGTQLVMLGILGEYLWRTFDESRGRPQYLIEEARGFAREGAAQEEPSETKQASVQEHVSTSSEA